MKRHFTSSGRSAQLLPIKPAIGVASRALCIVLLVGLSSFSTAQDQRSHFYEVVLGARSSEPASKPVVSAFIQAFPQAEIEFLKEPTHVSLKVPHELTERQLVPVLQNAGFELLSFSIERTEKPTFQLTSESFPSFIDTGNAEGDAAAYAEAKAMWIAQHPDEYQRMLLSAPRDGPYPK